MRCVPRMLACRNRRLGRPLKAVELEDVAQETLVRILGKLDSYAGRSSLETWAYGFCYHELANYLRKRGRRLPLFPIENDEPAAEEASQEEQNEGARALQFLQRLPEREAEVVHLRFVDGLGFGEIATVLGVSVSTAKTHCYRGLTKLRLMLVAKKEGSQ